MVDAPPGLSPLLERIYLSRGLTSGVELDRELSALARPQALPDVEKAARRLARAIQDEESILIVGDFDADGATSVALAVSLLEAMGASRVGFLVPNRFEFGYGLSPEIVEMALAEEPDVIVTVTCSSPRSSSVLSHVRTSSTESNCRSILGILMTSCLQDKSLNNSPPVQQRIGQLLRGNRCSRDAIT